MNDIEKLFEEYSDCIYRFCCNIADNLYEAEDLFQDTFFESDGNRSQSDGGRK